jgi:hypothetical protein
MIPSKILIFMLAIPVIGCAPSEPKVHWLNLNEHEKMKAFKEDLIQKAEATKHNKVLQIQLALIDWCASKPEEARKAAKVSKSDIAGYMIAKTHFAEYAAIRGVDTSTIHTIFKQQTPNFKSLLQLHE